MTRLTSVTRESLANRDQLCSSMRHFLTRFRGREVLFFPTPGNAGDSLIQVGIYQAFQRAGVPFRLLEPSDDLTGKVLFLGGGANLTPYYQELRQFIIDNDVLRRVSALVILPHTIRGNEDLLSEMDHRVTIFCRDVESYVHVSAHAKSPFVFLDHDMALHVDVAVFESQGYERSDAPALFERQLTEVGRADFLANEAGAQYFLRDDGESTLESLPPGNIDISTLYAFGTWTVNAEKSAWCLFEVLRRPASVLTDRLHVAIACSLLGLRCRLLDNVYGKCRAVYQHSIRKYSSTVEM